jgi:hypothetical protein
MNTIVPRPHAVFEYMPSGLRPDGLTKRLSAIFILLQVHDAQAASISARCYRDLAASHARTPGRPRKM